MAISLTSEGLNLEPKVYWYGLSGVNYGTPRFIDNRGCSLSGSWSGFRAIARSNIPELQLFSGVSSIEKYGTSGGNSFQSILTQSLEREVA